LRSRFSTMGAPPGLEERCASATTRALAAKDSREDRRVIVAGGVAVDAGAAARRTR
jgi:hypothetical protein